MMHGKPKYKGHIMCQFELNQLVGRAMLMGVMTRKGAYWSFKALGIPATGQTIQDVVQVSVSFLVPTRRHRHMCFSESCKLGVPAVEHLLSATAKERECPCDAGGRVGCKGCRQIRKRGII